MRSRAEIVPPFILSLIALFGCEAKPGAGAESPPAKRAVVRVSNANGGEKALLKALIEARPGTTIELGPGQYRLRRTLTLDVEDVRIKGAGAARTILNFKGQKAGAEGLLVTQGRFVIEDLAILDTVGDALKIKGGVEVVIRGLRVEWTGGPDPKNGAYGLYPVACKKVLIEDCAVKGASDAGIYVGQSKDIIVRRNRVEQNVAGIEIENSRRADVYENTATNNTGGILIFDLPNLPMKGGGEVRVFKNKVFSNNLANFAPEGNIVASVPAGTGLMVMANDRVEVFDNEVKDHGTSGLAVVSYLAVGKEWKDKAYDPFPEAIYVHDNRFSGSGEKPDGAIGKSLAPLVKTLPDILWDGIANPARLVDGALPKEAGLVLNNNVGARFLNFHLDKLQAGQPVLETDLSAVTGQLPPLPPVTFAAADEAP